MPKLSELLTRERRRSVSVTIPHRPTRHGELAERRLRTARAISGDCPAFSLYCDGPPPFEETLGV